jgi:hypothetical protein
MPRQTLRRIGMTILGYIGIEPHIPEVEKKYNGDPLAMITVLKAVTGLRPPCLNPNTTATPKLEENPCSVSVF